MYILINLSHGLRCKLLESSPLSPTYLHIVLCFSCDLVSHHSSLFQTFCGPLNQFSGKQLVCFAISLTIQSDAASVLFLESLLFPKGTIPTAAL